jgi:lysozyme
MELSKEGLRHLKKLEGFRNNPYLDTAGVPTIGYGFTYYPCGAKVTMNDEPITLKDAENVLLQLVDSFEEWVRDKVESNINQNMYDALVSFCYNVGKQAFEDSTLLKKVNNNPCDPTIEDEFKRWVYAGGKKSKGLKKRRNQEAYLYFS